MKLVIIILVLLVLYLSMSKKEDFAPYPFRGGSKYPHNPYLAYDPSYNFHVSYHRPCVKRAFDEEALPEEPADI